MRTVVPRNSVYVGVNGFEIVRGGNITGGSQQQLVDFRIERERDSGTNKEGYQANEQPGAQFPEVFPQRHRRAWRAAVRTPAPEVDDQQDDGGDADYQGDGAGRQENSQVLEYFQ